VGYLAGYIAFLSALFQTQRGCFFGWVQLH